MYNILMNIITYKFGVSSHVIGSRDQGFSTEVM